MNTPLLTVSPRRLLALAGAALALFVGCTTLAAPGNRDPESDPLTQRVEVKKTGAELWAARCRQCHNYRSPASLSDEQWEVALMHMRVRANLTGTEQRAILEFLQAAN